MQPNLIAGQWRDGAEARPDINPSDTSDVVGQFASADAAQARTAVSAAAEAADGWAATPGAVRGEILDRAGAELLARSDELGNLLAREEGKTLPEAVAEVVRAGQLLKFHGGQAVRNIGEHLESLRPGIEVTVTREPVGVVSVITPWNFPIAIPAWKIAPALAYGNTVVLKPADAVPASAWALADALNRAGLPPGVLNLVMGRGREIGDVLTGSAEISAVSFTGSVSTGERVLATAAARKARVQLEMGGKNPLVVEDDADLDLAVEVALQGSYGSTGQRCTASSRLVIAGQVHDEFVSKLWARLQAWYVGDARAAGTDMGPVVDAGQLAQICTTSLWPRRRAPRCAGASNCGARNPAITSSRRCSSAREHLTRSTGRRSLAQLRRSSGSVTTTRRSRLPMTPNLASPPVSSPGRSPGRPTSGAGPRRAW